MLCNSRWNINRFVKIVSYCIYLDNKKWFNKVAPRCKIVCSHYHSQLLPAHIFHLHGCYIQNILANLKTLSFFITNCIQSRVINIANKVVGMDLVWYGQSNEVAFRVHLQCLLISKSLNFVIKIIVTGVWWYQVHLNGASHCFINVTNNNREVSKDCNLLICTYCTMYVAILKPSRVDVTNEIHWWIFEFLNSASYSPKQNIL